MSHMERGPIPDPLDPNFRGDQLPPSFYPIDDWRIVEDGFREDLIPRMETVFALANGYLGLRGNFEESRPSYENGTYVNGFHETWPITHAEEAYGFAKTGQTIVNVPDGKVIKLYIDDEPLFLPSAHLHRFRRTLDLRAGLLERDLLWELPSGKLVEVRSTRMVSFEHRHVAVLTFDVTILNDSAPVVISSQLVNRERLPPDELAEDFDPRRATPISGALVHEVSDCRDERLAFGYRTESSGMTMACGADHHLTVDSESTFTTECNEHFGKVVYTVDAQPEQTIRIVKYLAYHTSNIVPSSELVDRVHRSLDRARRQGPEELKESQRSYLAGFWDKCDVEIDNGQDVQQAVRWNLFQLAQAGSRAEGVGVAAKGLTGQAYEGHYFWDTEVYSLPFFIYTSPRIARNLLKFRHKMLPQARIRAEQLSQKGALFPWRTINGEEASAYYEAGTAQYHINADIAYALQKYLQVTGDRTVLADFGAEILVETARLWADLGFFKEQTGEFHIHGVTGPDEYTTLVNDNCYTNLMARENLRASARLLRELAVAEPEEYESLVADLDLREDEIELWDRAADAMFIPFDEVRGIHPQDANFLDKEIWDFESMPPDRYPLLLHYHPLVIYRFQVLKQADVVLAMFLLSNDFSQEDKMHNFYYYDPLTTGDSSLSASVQSIIAAEIGDMDNAMRYFRRGLFMDLADVAGNAGDGVHVAAAGGVWLNLVYGFGGLRDAGGELTFEPRLPGGWNRLAFRLRHRGRALHVELTHDKAILSLEEGSTMKVKLWGEAHDLALDEPLRVAMQQSAID